MELSPVYMATAETLDENFPKIRAWKFGNQATFDFRYRSEAERLQPSMIAVTQLAQNIEEQLECWSTSYEFPSRFEHHQFKHRIDTFVREREDFMSAVRADLITPEIFAARSRELGTLLAMAYGMVNTDSLDWTHHVRVRAEAGGLAYAQPSVDANTKTSLPGIARATAMLVIATVKLFADYSLEHESDIYSAIAGVYIVYSLVQIATLIYYPIWSGTVQSRAVALQNAVGPKWIPTVKAEYVMREDRVTRKALRNKREVQIDIDKALGSSSTDAAALQAFRYELNVSALYTQLAIMHHQGDNRRLRALLNIAAAGSSMAGAAGSAAFGPWWQFGWSIGTLGLLTAQPVLYSANQGEAAAKDNLDKLATMFQIAAVTGIGNLTDDQGIVKSGTLDKVVRGPAQLRIDCVRDILEFDKRVYATAIIAHEKNAAKGILNLVANSYAVGETGYEYRDELTSGVTVIHHDLSAASFQDILKEFAQCDNKEKRKKLLVDIRGGAAPAAQSVKILELYEDACEAISCLSNGEEGWQDLLGENSKLPPDSRQLIFEALKLATNVSDDQQNTLSDRQLCELKGYTESCTDVGSIHQAAQKLGQSLEWGVAGPLGPNVVKAVFSMIQGVMYTTHGPALLEAINKMTLGQGAIQILGSIASIFLGYAYHMHIFLKDSFRARDKENNVAIPNLGLLDKHLLPNFNRSQVSLYTTLLAKPIEQSLQPQSLDFYSTVTFAKDVLKQMFVVSPGKAFKCVSAQGGKLGVEALKDAAAEESAPELQDVVLDDMDFSNAQKQKIVKKGFKSLKISEEVKVKFAGSVKKAAKRQAEYNLAQILEYIYIKKRVGKWITIFLPPHRNVFKGGDDEEAGFDDISHVRYYITQTEFPELLEGVIQCCAALQRLETSRASDLFKKKKSCVEELHSSLTMFYVATRQTRFQKLLNKFFEGRMHAATVEALKVKR